MTINLTALQKQRYDTAANWTGANPTLLAGEIGIESDTLRWKVGNGSTAWTSLGYIPGLAYGTARQLLQTNSGATAAEWTSNVDIPGTLDVTGTSTLDGMVLIGTTTSIGGGKLQLSSDTTTTIQNFSFNATADSSTAMLQFIRGRGTKASPSVVLNGDYLGEIRFLGYGTTYNTGASIRAIVDGDPATAGDTSDMPTKLVFLTSPNGSSTPDTRMTIDSAGLVTIPGDLTVNGTTTTINSTTLVVQDKNIEMGVVATPTDVTADGGGITLKGTTDKTINWIDATDAWTLSEHVNIASAKEYRIAGTKVLDATSLGSAVVSSSLTSVGTIGTGVWQGSTIGKAYGGTGQTSYTDGQLLIGNSTGNTLTKSTLTAGSNITITNGNGSITIASSNPGGTVTNVSGTAPISVANGTTTPAISIAAATTSVVGAVQLSDSTSTTSSVLAATPTAVKAAYDLAAAALPLAGGTVTGNLEIGTAGSLSFEGATADGFETTIAVVDPTADRTITLPNTTGTVVTTGDTGTVTSTMLLDNTIVNADINASAAIVDTKLDTIATAGKVSNSATTATDVNTASAIVARDASGNFTAGTITAALTGAASSNVLKAGDTMTGVLAVTAGTAALPAITPSGDPNTGIYSPGADQLAISTNGSGRLFVDSNGDIQVGAASTLNAAVLSATANPASKNLYLAFNGTTTGADFLMGGISANANGTNIGAVDIYRDSSDNHGYISFRTKNGTTLGERVRITATGSVGIGTSNPQVKSHIVDTNGDVLRLQRDGAFTGSWGVKIGQAITGDFTLRDEENNLNVISIPKGTGRVGIGTTSPSVPFHVLTSTTNTPGLFENSGSVDSYLFIKNSAGGAYVASRTNDLSFHTAAAATERARIDSSGRLLVGTDSGSGDALLGIQGRIGDTGRGGILQLRRGQAASALSAGDDIGAIRFSDNTSGNTGFAEILCASDGASGSGDYPGRLVFSVTGDGSANPTGRALIDNRGAFNMFAAAGGDGHVFMTGEGAGTTYYLFAGFRSATSVFGASAAMVFQVFTNGNTQNTNNSYAGISDLKLKENIVDATSQWDDLKALQVRKYNFKEETGHQTHTQIGLVAQEVELVSPGLVNESPDRDEDGNDLGTVTKSVNYSVLYMKAVKALQEAMERIEQLETSNTDLLARVIALEAN